jgi:hypothetical protein
MVKWGLTYLLYKMAEASRDFTQRLDDNPLDIVKIIMQMYNPLSLPSNSLTKESPLPLPHPPTANDINIFESVIWIQEVVYLCKGYIGFGFSLRIQTNAKQFYLFL